MGMMLEPARCNFSIVRGTTEPLTMLFHLDDDAETPIAYDNIELVIARNDVAGPAILRLTLLDGGLSHVTFDDKQWIQWMPTEAQSRLIPPGRIVHYEVQVITGGSRRVYLVGRITGIGGLNDDA